MPVNVRRRFARSDPPATIIGKRGRRRCKVQPSERVSESKKNRVSRTCEVVYQTRGLQDAFHHLPHTNDSPRETAKSADTKCAADSFVFDGGVFRYTSQYAAPLRSREYSTPPSYSVSRPPSRSGSFASFIDYSSSKYNELSRNGSRSSLYDANQNLSRSRYSGHREIPQLPQ